MWGRVDNWQQGLVFIAVLPVAICIALALHYLLVRILGGLARRSGSKMPDLLIRHLRQPTRWVMILLAASLSGELLALPPALSEFTKHPFQNWTRASADLLGTVLLYADYTAPVDALRAELQRILSETDLWDRKVGLLQVTNASERTLELRVLVSAPDAGTAWDLRCHVREKLVEFLQKNYPQALPKLRAELGRPEDPSSADARV